MLSVHSRPWSRSLWHQTKRTATGLKSTRGQRVSSISTRFSILALAVGCVGLGHKPDVHMFSHNVTHTHTHIRSHTRTCTHTHMYALTLTLTLTLSHLPSFFSVHRRRVWRSTTCQTRTAGPRMRLSPMRLQPTFRCATRASTTAQATPSTASTTMELAGASALTLTRLVHSLCCCVFCSPTHQTHDPENTGLVGFEAFCIDVSKPRLVPTER